MIKSTRPISLYTKMFYMLLLSIVCSMATFFLIAGIGKHIVDTVYMSPSSVSSRTAEIYSAFNSYVKSNNLRADDAAAIAEWDEYSSYVDILVYSPEDDASGSSPLPSHSQYHGQHGKLYPMRFSDGTFYIAIDDNTYNKEIMLNNIAAVVAACLILIVIMLGFIRRIATRIIKLSEEALEIGTGDLDHPITVEGNDELTMLADEMDNMRRSVIEHMGNEQRAWQANSELITAISHDIRTPMTSLIGYLGLLNNSDFSDPERCHQFSQSAYGKAMELKDLTDELFRYFLVFGKSDLDMNLESYDGRLLLQQFLSEAQFELMEKGFDVQNIEFKGDCDIVADPLYLKRVMDNLVSNIKKYADKSFPLMFISELKDNELSVCISNHVAKNVTRVESTKIGLRTCQKIMDHMGGKFLTHFDDEHYAAEFTLPAQIKEA